MVRQTIEKKLCFQISTSCYERRRNMHQPMKECFGKKKTITDYDFNKLLKRTENHKLTTYIAFKLQIILFK